MKITKMHAINLDNIFKFIITEENKSKFPMQVRLNALNNLQVLAPYAESYKKLSDPIIEKGREEAKSLELPEEKKEVAFRVLLEEKFQSDEELQTWLKEEAEINILTLNYKSVEEKLTEDHNLEIINLLVVNKILT